MRRGRNKKWAIVAVVLLLAALLGAEVYRSNCSLVVTGYQATSSKITEPFRIVQLTDLHNAQFGAENADLIARVAEQEPDLILLTGDLVTGRTEDTAVAVDAIEKLARIAPVYASIGNHEQMHQRNFGTDLTALYEKAGAKVLEYAYEDLAINGQALRIGGASGYCLPEIYLASGEAKEEECAWLREFQDTDRCTLLMCHMPAAWILNDAISYWDADLVFSGHVHGGQVVLPLLGGLYGPDMGWFPGRLEGLFPSDDGSKTLVLSSGLGSSIAFRLNNPPQILVLDVLPQ